jgi:hypothetical protein
MPGWWRTSPCTGSVAVPSGTDRVIGGMTKYEVVITDGDVLPQTDDQKGQHTRVRVWQGLAESEHDAGERAWIDWDRQYGVGKRPLRPIVQVSDVIPASSA